MNMASMLKGAAKVISQAAGGNVPVNEIVVAMTLVFVLYSFIGGLVATAWTDFLQGFLIIALSFLLIPLGWSSVAGMSGMRESLAAYKFSLATPQGIGLWFICMLTVNGLIGIVAQPHLMATVGTGKDEYTCRVGFLYGTFVKRFCTIGWAMVGLMVAAMIARGVVRRALAARPRGCFRLRLPARTVPRRRGPADRLRAGRQHGRLLGLQVDCGALFTRNFYKKYLVPSRPDRHYLWVGRFSGLVITLLAVVYAMFFIQRVLYSFLLTETMATFVGISVLGGIFWRRANRWGAISSIVVAMGTNFAVYHLRNQRLDHWDPNVFLAALVAGTITLVVVSLLTPPEPVPALDSFFGRLQTPSDGGEEWKKIDPRTVSEQGRQLLLVNLFHLRRGAAGVPFMKAYHTDLRGFAIGWIIAGAMVAFAWLVFSAMSGVRIYRR